MGHWTPGGGRDPVDRPTRSGPRGAEKGDGAVADAVRGARSALPPSGWRRRRRARVAVEQDGAAGAGPEVVQDVLPARVRGAEQPGVRRRREGAPGEALTTRRVPRQHTSPGVMERNRRMYHFRRLPVLSNGPSIRPLFPGPPAGVARTGRRPIVSNHAQSREKGRAGPCPPAGGRHCRHEATRRIQSSSPPSLVPGVVKVLDIGAVVFAPDVG